MSAIDPETLMLCGYALFLVGTAAVLDLLARHSHRRSEHYRTAGFRFHAHLDAWECPEGEHLWPHELDRERRLVRYRARPQVCNACRAKAACTDSDEGRELVTFLDEWPRLEAGRFHRGLALTLVVLAALLAVASVVRHHDPAETAVAAAVLAVVMVVGVRFAPAREPGGALVRRGA